MLSMRRSLGEYLRHIGQFEPRPLGKKPRSITSEDSQFLRETLGRQVKSNAWIIVVAVVLLVFLFALEVFLILYNLNSIPATAVISATTFASLLGIIGYLRRLWLDKSIMNVLIHATYVIAPEDLAKLVASLYYKGLDTQLEAGVARQGVQSAALRSGRHP
jgi:hypothetical protein